MYVPESYCVVDVSLTVGYMLTSTYQDLLSGIGTTYSQFKPAMPVNRSSRSWEGEWETMFTAALGLKDGEVS